MDYELYYLAKGNGTYAVHFPNNVGWTEEEIRTQFSAYGNVVDVNTRGQKNGLCFVHYGTLEDVKRCVDGFNKEKTIKILVQKTKMHLLNKQPVQKKQNLSKNTSLESLVSVAKSKDNGKRKKESTQNKGPQNSNSSVASKLSTASVPNSSMGTKCSSLTSLAKSTTSVALEDNLRSKLLRLYELTRSKETNSRTNNCNGQTDLPGLMSLDTEKFSMSTPNSSISIQNNVALAGEIIVANIHPMLGIHYILHLFEKHDPIAVSLMKTVSKNALRYCHIYFKTIQEAKEIEKKFDNYALYGNSLIVLTPQKLIQEALLL